MVFSFPDGFAGFRGSILFVRRLLARCFRTQSAQRVWPSMLGLPHPRKGRGIYVRHAFELEFPRVFACMLRCAPSWVFGSLLGRLGRRFLSGSVPTVWCRRSDGGVGLLSLVGAVPNTVGVFRRNPSTECALRLPCSGSLCRDHVRCAFYGARLRFFSCVPPSVPQLGVASGPWFFWIGAYLPWVSLFWYHLPVTRPSVLCSRSWRTGRYPSKVVFLHGASPRVRGNLVLNVHSHQFLRSIPARAGGTRLGLLRGMSLEGLSPRVPGETSLPAWLAPPSRVYPRACRGRPRPIQRTSAWVR